MYFIALFGAFAFSGFLLGLKQCIKKKNPYGLTPVYNIIGSFVWTDAVIFGAFWTIISFICLIFQSILLFFTVFSLFWLVRSIGETIYWFNEQFAVNKRNKPETLWHSKIFPGTSSYVASQIFWQCMTVVTILTSIFAVSLWF